jgi:hypothetical protein
MIYETPGLQILSILIYLFLIFISVIVAVMGSLVIIPLFTRKEIDEKEEIVKNRNIGIALVLGSFIWTIGRMCLEAVKPIMNAWYVNYSKGFTLVSAGKFTLGILGSLIIALLAGAITVFLAIKVLMVINKDINEWQEIKNGNTAVAVIISVTVVIVGMFFESVISAIVATIFTF